MLTAFPECKENRGGQKGREQIGEVGVLGGIDLAVQLSIITHSDMNTML